MGAIGWTSSKKRECKTKSIGSKQSPRNSQLDADHSVARPAGQEQDNTQRSNLDNKQKRRWKQGRRTEGAETKTL
ncbi:hypothetical protein N7509_009244 [Penicillium cosmopolitanum]|uniref:Uncharacterized protein n=1 Tax=Penicillium cosmopolitanum TaxID=1131564 RepID=A0A9X0B3E7_9EURO|nr:uncharacterized protein N7509_009244 [Penicillium cosmopolitanum]KAJ5386703.1 hypothetical protein N7509_009244 [Penicillium cosmopolitanum]